jgi:Na+/H+-dicarboxylate symporter
MFRTMVNVLSDSCGAVIVAKLDGEEVLTPG